MEDYDFDNLAQFDDDFTPTKMALRLDALVPGEYSAVIDLAKLERVTVGAAAGDTIVKWLLSITFGPAAIRQTVEHTSWLNSPAAVGRFGGELLTLGIDTVSWLPPSRPFSKMLPPALVGLAGRSVSFRVSTWMNKKKGQNENQLRFLGIGPVTMGAQSSLPF